MDFEFQVFKAGHGEIIVARRPTESHASAADYVPCSHCLAFIRQDTLWYHVKNSCWFRPASSDGIANCIRDGRFMMQPFLNKGQTDEDDELEELIQNMRETTDNPGLRKICLEDDLIREFGRSLLGRLGTKEEQRLNDKNNIRTKLRSVGRLLKHLNEQQEVAQPLSKYITGKGFKTVMNAVKSLSLQTDSPSLAITLGHYVKQICLLKGSLAVEKDDDIMEKEKQNFKTLFDAHWCNQVSSVANRRSRLRGINKTILVPRTSDLVTLKQHMDEAILRGIRNESPTYEQWGDLARMILVRIAIYNKRRISEVEQLKLSDMERVGETTADNEELYASLDVSERALAAR